MDAGALLAALVAAALALGPAAGAAPSWDDTFLRSLKNTMPGMMLGMFEFVCVSCPPSSFKRGETAESFECSWKSNLK